MEKSNIGAAEHTADEGSQVNFPNNFPLLIDFKAEGIRVKKWLK